jgi:hypothetical protein
MMIASPIAWSAGSLYSKKGSSAAPARLTEKVTGLQLFGLTSNEPS